MDLTHPSARLIVSTCKASGLLRNQAAYVLATAWHESGQFRYMREIWGPTAAQKRYEGRKDLGNTVAGDGKRYLGRGFVQITGRKNYTQWANLTGMDLVNKPELAEQPAIAARIIVEGMSHGTFTGKKLSDYVTLAKSDFVGARRIVNGTDKADLIAGYAKQFESLLKAEGYGESGKPAQSVPAPAAPSAPQPAPAAKSGWLAALLSLLASLFARKA